ncbi:hypothetical protein J8J40_34855, partial [Mycobacterium tuberculosis]|nr:hypothetical protein [Mycobacterium tuberculosis]
MRDADGSLGIAGVTLRDAFLPSFAGWPKTAPASLDGILGLAALTRPLQLGHGEVRDVTLDAPQRSGGAATGERVT